MAYFECTFGALIPGQDYVAMPSREEAHATAARWTSRPDTVRGVRWTCKHGNLDRLSTDYVVVEMVPWRLAVASDVPADAPYCGPWPYRYLGLLWEKAQDFSRGQCRPSMYDHGRGPCLKSGLVLTPGTQPLVTRNQLQPGETFGYLNGSPAYPSYIPGGPPPPTPPPVDWRPCLDATSTASVLRLPHWDPSFLRTAAPTAIVAPARPPSDLERLEAEVTRLRAATFGNRTGAELVEIYTNTQHERLGVLAGEALLRAQACWTAQVRLKVAQADAQAAFQERHRVVCGTDVDDDI